MEILLVAMLLFGDTVKLANGELFEGNIIRETDRKVWLQLNKAGVLVFDKVDLDNINGKPLHPKAPLESGHDGGLDNGAASGQEKPNQPSRPDASGKDGQDGGMIISPEGAAEKPADPSSVEKCQLPCPAGFMEDKRSLAPPYVLVYREKGTDAVMSLRLEPFSQTFSEAIEQVRHEIGHGLKAERSFAFEHMNVEARLLEWDMKEKDRTISCMSLIMVHGNRLYRLSARVNKDFFPGYQVIYRDAFKKFRIPSAPAAEPAVEVPAVPAAELPAEPPASVVSPVLKEQQSAKP